MSTGEDIPRGQSLQSRFWLVEIAPDNVDVDELSACQRDANSGVYAQAMSAFLQWLAPQYRRVKKALTGEIETLRDSVTRPGQHPRTPEIIANLLLGLRHFLRFATEVEALEAEKAKALLVKAQRALEKAAATQALGQAAEEPAQRFLNLIAAVVARGDACLPEAGVRVSRQEKELIGWTTEEDGLVFLLPELAYAAVNQLSREQGEPFPVRLKTLGKRLQEGGYLTAHDAGRNTTQVTVAGSRSRVWSIRKSDIFPLSEELELGE